MHRKKPIIFGLLSLALLFRLFLLRHRIGVGWDAPNYLQMATSFVGSWQAFFHPYSSLGLPLLIGLVNLVSVRKWYLY